MESKNDYPIRFTPLEIKKKYHNLSQSFGKKRYFSNIKINPSSDLSITGFTPQDRKKEDEEL